MPYIGSRAVKYAMAVAACTPLSALWQGQSSALATTAEIAMAVNCHIRVSDDAKGLHLEAVADADEAIVGHYELLVTKNSASGSSENLQSGNFQLAAKRERVLTTLILDRSAIDHYKATLSLKWDGGKKSCTSP